MATQGVDQSDTDPRADYTVILALCTTDELGKMLICSVKLGDTDFADALREEIKHRGPCIVRRDTPDTEKSRIP